MRVIFRAELRVASVPSNAPTVISWSTLAVFGELLDLGAD